MKNVVLLGAIAAFAGACGYESGTGPDYDGTPQTQPRVTQSHMTYVGSFRVPHNDNSGSQNNTFAYGGTALGYNPANNSLFYGGHDWYQELAEIAIPDVIAATATASVVQQLSDVTGGRMGSVDDGNVKLGGTLWYNGRLIVTAYSYYDADGNQRRTHFALSNGSTSGAGVSGPFEMGGVANARSKAGYMGIVPEEWRSLLGGPALTGNCCLSIISASSAGPSVSVFNPDDVGVVNPVPATTLLFYPLGNATTQNGTSHNEIFVQSDVVAGVAFPRGTRSVLFFGRHGQGPYCYGPGTSNAALVGTPSGEGDPWCYDPAASSKGTHAYPYRHQVWAYDANDLLAVKNGEREVWDVRPYAVWTLTEMDSSGGAGIRGAAFDPVTGRVFITEAYGETPVVHVYRISLAP
jgi:hypothetical protein